MSSSVYIIPHSSEPRFKVGYSADARVRFWALGPVNLKLDEGVILRVANSDRARQLEKQLHTLLAVFHVEDCPDGVEWFATEGLSLALSQAHRLARSSDVTIASVDERLTAPTGSKVLRPVQPRVRKQSLGLSIRPDPLAGARAWKQLLVARQFETQLALSVGLGLAPGEVRKTLSLLELPPEIQGIIESNRALSALDTLYYIRRVFCRDGLDAARFLALRACRENLGVRDVRREAGGVRKIEVSAVKVAGVLGEMSVCVESGTLQLNFEDLSVNSLDLVQKALRHLA